MLRSALSTLVVALVLLGTAGTASAADDPLLAPESVCPGQSWLGGSVWWQEKTMLCMIDHARRTAGLPPLTADARLMDSADRKARDVLSCQQFTHTPCGRAWTVHIDAVGYPWRTLGENIAWGTGPNGTVRKILNGWLQSPGHRGNLLSRDFADHGIALVVGTFQGWAGARIWVDQFGAKRTW